MRMACPDTLGRHGPIPIGLTPRQRYTAPRLPPCSLAATARAAATEAKQAPQPPALPVLGHAPLMVAHLAGGGSLETLLLKWVRSYGPFVQWSLPLALPVMVVADPEAIREVFEVRNYPKSPLYKDLLPVLGEQSMVVTEGEVWRAQRDAFNPGFSSSFLRSAQPDFVLCTRNLTARLAEAAESGEVVRMHDLAVLLTLEVICKVGFGEPVQLLGAAGINAPLWTSFEELGRHVAWFLDNPPLNRLKLLPWNQMKTQRLQAALDTQLTAILRRRLSAMGVTPRSASSNSSNSGNSNDSGSSSTDSGRSAAGPPSGACPFHQAGAAVQAVPGSSQAAGAESIDWAASSGEGSCPAAAAAGVGGAGGKAKDILSLAVSLSAADGAIDEAMLLSQMKTFFAAGHDTTASLVAWAIYYLCRNPEVKAQLVAELDQVLGGSSDPSSPSWQQLSELKVLNCVLKETLRVRPPVGLIARRAPPGAPALAGYDTEGRVLLVSPYVMHMDTGVWGADAELWRPERWLDEAGSAANAPQYSYLPFSKGSRDCIGARFAMLEAKTILAMVLGEFELEYAGERAEEVMMSITAHPKFGVPLRVRRRRAPAPLAVAGGAGVGTASARPAKVAPAGLAP